MADVRQRVAAKIVDPSTNANEMGVTAAGEAKVIINAALPAGSNSIGTVDTELTTQDYDSGAGTSNVAVSGVVVAASGGPVAITGDVPNGLDVDVTRVSGNVTVVQSTPGSLTTQATGAAASGSAVSGNPVLVAGSDGTNARSLSVNSSGRLQVDVTSGGGSTTPTSPQKVRATSASVAAGSSANLDSTQVTSGKTGKLAQVTVSASVPVKVDLQTMLNGTGTTVATFFVPAGDMRQYTPPHADYIQQAESATAGLDGFRAVVTNNDNSAAADVYAQFLWQEV